MHGPGQGDAWHRDRTGSVGRWDTPAASDWQLFFYHGLVPWRTQRFQLLTSCQGWRRSSSLGREFAQLIRRIKGLKGNFFPSSGKHGNLFPFFPKEGNLFPFGICNSGGIGVIAEAFVLLMGGIFGAAHHLI